MKTVEASLLILQLDSLGRAEIASRLTLNCTDSYVEPQKLRGIKITLLDVSLSLSDFTCLAHFPVLYPITNYAFAK